MLSAEYWRRKGAAVQGVLALVLVACAGIADWLLGPEVPLTLGYLVPIALAAWCFRRWVALATTVIAATGWLVTEILEHEMTLQPGVHFLNFALQFALFLAFGRLVFALSDLLQRERRLAHSDPLTGLANRRAFWADLDREIRRCRRFSTRFSVAYVDVDDFKSINDRCGHEQGDQVLQRIARTVQGSIRDLDVAARIGGDEFAVLLPGTPEDGAHTAVARLAGALARADLLPGGKVNCSIGCLSVRSAPGSVDELVARADALMYAAKRLGDGLVQHGVFDPRTEVAADKVRRATS